MLLNYIMVSVYDYTFNQQTRIGDDSCDLSQENLQYNAAAQYMLENYRTQCPMSNAVKFATNQPAINFTGSHQVGINGCNIDTNSKLLHDPLTKPACKISLFQRPFATVPFLGRGKSNVVLESQLIQSTYFLNQDGTAIENVPGVKRMKEIPIPLPPIHEQLNLVGAVREKEKNA